MSRLKHPDTCLVYLHENRGIWGGDKSIQMKEAASLLHATKKRII